MKDNTYGRRRNTVSTWQKSAAKISSWPGRPAPPGAVHRPVKQLNPPERSARGGAWPPPRRPGHLGPAQPGPSQEPLILRGCKPGHIGRLPGFASSAIDQHRVGAPQVWCNDDMGVSLAARRRVELGHELAVGGPGGGEVLVALFELEPQVDGLLLEAGDLLVEVMPCRTLSASRTPGSAPWRASIAARAWRRAPFTALVVRARACGPPAAISSSVRQVAGTEATRPNSSFWSVSTRKSLITSLPSAIAQARSAVTRPRSWTSGRGEASACDSPPAGPVCRPARAARPARRATRCPHHRQ